MVSLPSTDATEVEITPSTEPAKHDASAERVGDKSKVAQGPEPEPEPSHVSAFIDPVGRSTGETPVFEQASGVGEIRWMRGRTGYEIWGDAPWWLGLVVVAAMGVIRRTPEGRMRLEI